MLSRSRLADAAAVLLPGVVTAALVFSDLGARSLWIDEAASVTIASQHGAAFGAALAHDGGNMLGFYAILHVLISAFGSSTFLLRVPAAVSAIAAVLLIGTIALRLFGRRVALVGGLFSAVSLPLVYWGQDARAYAPMIMFVTASYLVLLATLDARSRNRTILGVVGYVIVTTLALYMSFIAVLILPAQLIYVVAWRRTRLVATGVAMAITAVFAAPLAVLAHQRGAGQLFWVPKPSLSALVQVGESITSSGFEPNFHATATTGVLLVVTLLGLIVFALVRSNQRASAPSVTWGRTDATWCLLLWIAVPVILALGWSLVAQSVFTERNLLIALPPVGIALAEVTVGGAFASFTSRLLPTTTGPIVGIGCAVAILTLRALQLAPSYGVSPENWQAGVHDVLAKSEPGDCIAFYPEDGEMAFRYYIDATPGAATTAPHSVLPQGEWSQITTHVEQYVTPGANEIAALLRDCPRLWLVTSHVGQVHGPPISQQHYAQFEELRSLFTSDFKVASSAAYGYADPVDVTLFVR